MGGLTCSSLNFWLWLSLKRPRCPTRKRLMTPEESCLLKNQSLWLPFPAFVTCLTSWTLGPAHLTYHLHWLLGFHRLPWTHFPVGLDCLYTRSLRQGWTLVIPGQLCLAVLLEHGKGRPHLWLMQTFLFCINDVHLQTSWSSFPFLTLSLSRSLKQWDYFPERRAGYRESRSHRNSACGHITKDYCA